EVGDDRGDARRGRIAQRAEEEQQSAELVVGARGSVGVERLDHIDVGSAHAFERPRLVLAILEHALLVRREGDAEATRHALADIAAFDAVYRVDLAVRQAQYLGSTGSIGGNLIAIRGMAFGPDGTLYAASDNQKTLVTLAPNAAAHVVGSLGLAGQGRGQFDL